LAGLVVVVVARTAAERLALVVSVAAMAQILLAVERLARLILAVAVAVEAAVQILQMLPVKQVALVLSS
jgi:hypothetical protein